MAAREILAKVVPRGTEVQKVMMVRQVLQGHLVTKATLVDLVDLASQVTQGLKV